MIAKPNALFVGRPLLQKAVLLVVEHDEGGETLALTLNRPTEYILRAVLEDPSQARLLGERPLQLGGPEGCDNGDDGGRLRLLTTAEATPGALPLLPGLAMANLSAAAGAVGDGIAEPSAFEVSARPLPSQAPVGRRHAARPATGCRAPRGPPSLPHAAPFRRGPCPCSGFRRGDSMGRG